jgi:hypothetical protein
MNGHLACLKYAHEHQCPWNELTCMMAAFGGHLECLKYAYENGCPWSIRVCQAADATAQLWCLRYAHENGCEYPTGLLPTIVHEVLIPKWREAVRMRTIAFYWQELAGHRSYSESGEGRKRDREAYEADFSEDKLEWQGLVGATPK